MCGFAVIKNKNFVYPQRIAHRGIEVSEQYFGEFKLVHYRLPLQTVEGDSWKQPIPVKNGMLLFNGEIFNYPERFTNDVEYLQDYFSRDWGSLNSEYNTWDGFWSIVLIQNNKVYAFTDPLGKKQLYYDSYGNISSEIKPLLNTTNFNEKFNFTTPEITGGTPFKGIYRIQPNSLYIFDKGSTKIYSDVYNLRQNPYTNNLRQLLLDSVRVRNINLKDKNTLFVSGGLDSTIILHCIHELGLIENFEFITIENSEDDYIKVVEDHYKIQVERIQYPPMIDFEAICTKYEYPFDFGSIAGQNELVRNTKGSVIFTGDGADELFSGYGRAQIQDTQEFDVFTELPFYHNIRLDRIGMTYTKEIRSPFMGHYVVRFALNCPYSERLNKVCLKQSFSDLPIEILERSKKPLRLKEMDQDRKKYQDNFLKIFKSIQYA